MATADITSGLADVLVVKSAAQLAAAKGAGQASAKLFKDTLIEKILDAVDAETDIKMIDIGDSAFLESALPKIAGHLTPKIEPDDVRAWKCVCACAFSHACECVPFHAGAG